MTTASDQELISRAVRSPGRLILGPTNITSPPLYGGLSLGFHEDGEVIWSAKYQVIPEPSSGLVARMCRRAVEYPEIYCTIDGPNWDEDSINQAFSQVAPATSLAVRSPAESRVEGTIIPFEVEASPPLLFAPFDTGHRGFYIRRPHFLLSLRKAVAINDILGAGLPMRFCPSPDSLWATIPFYQCCKVENMVL